MENIKTLNTTIPTYSEWHNNSSFYLCDVFVMCKDGETQYIKDVNLNYGLSTKELLLSKRGDLIEDYFFVKEILHVTRVRVTNEFPKNQQKP